jgi:hypothetical protein
LVAAKFRTGVPPFLCAWAKEWDDVICAMNNRIQLIMHDGKQILIVDFSHGTKQEIMPLLDEIQDVVAESPNGSLLTLADFTDAQIDKAVATRMKEVLALDRPHVKRSAWVGTEKLPNAFYDNFKSFSQREFPTFASRDEAIAWLVKND